jgi:hypothetical protein
MEDEPIHWVDAWQQLVYEHSPFSAVEDRDFQVLLQRLSELERLFLTTPALESYAAEWRTPRAGAAGGPSSGSASPFRNPADETESKAIAWATIHVAAIQLQLMEDAYYSLRLDRYANAPDNRGWMNQFRRWCESPTFRGHVRDLEATFTRQFIEFYYHYVEGLKIDEPVPHPWDLRAAERNVMPSYAGITKRAVERCMEPQRKELRGSAKGIFLDPGLIEAGASDSYEEPRPVDPQQHGAAPGSTTPPAAAGPASAPTTDSSKSTD